MMVGRLLSFWEGQFLVAILIFGVYVKIPTQMPIVFAENPIFF